MTDVVRRLPVRTEGDRSPEWLLEREWLVTNGRGGYASGTLAGAATRRYHGLLVASLPAPRGRTVMLNHLAERVIRPGAEPVTLGGHQLAEDRLELSGAPHLEEFALELGLPVWRFRIGDAVLEKRVLMVHQHNTTHVAYRLLAGEPVRLELCPSVHFRPHEAAVTRGTARYRLSAEGARYEIDDQDEEVPPLRLKLSGRDASLILRGGSVREVFYRLEADRGYESRGVLYSPGNFTAELAPGADVVLIASTEPWSIIDALDPAIAAAAERERREQLLTRARVDVSDPVAAQLVLAADQFIISPSGRESAAVRAWAAGEDLRTVIAGYHWFTDWGRDTMISLEGLTLATGSPREGKWILRTFADSVRDGLIPNLFPEGEREGLYHTADASLWFFHAVDRYVAATGDAGLLQAILPRLQEISARHLAGTRFGIGVDPADGLLRQGEEGYQLTWMDAKVGDWVVTPRRGKAVEINALWYNALCLLAGWLEERGDSAAAETAEQARRVRESFNQRFWYERGGHLYDVVDGEHGDDPACRPNQILAVSLPHPVLHRGRWSAVVNTVRERLLTPVGLRTLDPAHADFRARYFGDLRARDAAYHQGTVWAWLIGPFIDAWLKLNPGEMAGARALLEGFIPHLDEACVGSISEIFDAEAPFTPRGCIAQAWSVAEVLRCWLATSDGGTVPPGEPA